MTMCANSTDQFEFTNHTNAENEWHFLSGSDMFFEAYCYGNASNSTNTTNSTSNDTHTPISCNFDAASNDYCKASNASGDSGACCFKL